MKETMKKIKNRLTEKANRAQTFAKDTRGVEMVEILGAILIIALIIAAIMLIAPDTFTNLWNKTFAKLFTQFGV